MGREMALVVLDSSFLIAYHNSGDVHHEAARRGMDVFLSGEWGKGLLLEYVFLEVVTVLLARRGIETAIRVGSKLLQARELQFVPCSELFVDTFEIFRQQRQTSWSFADAAIVATARRCGAERIATFDTDFRDIDGITMVPV